MGEGPSVDTPKQLLIPDSSSRTECSHPQPGTVALSSADCGADTSLGSGGVAGMGSWVRGVWVLVPALPRTGWGPSSRESALSIRGGAESHNLPLSLQALTFYKDRLWAPGSGDRSRRKTHSTAGDQRALPSVTQPSCQAPPCGDKDSARPK